MALTDTNFDNIELYSFQQQILDAFERVGNGEEITIVVTPNGVGYVMV